MPQFERARLLRQHGRRQAERSKRHPGVQQSGAAATKPACTATPAGTHAPPPCLHPWPCLPAPAGAPACFVPWPPAAVAGGAEESGEALRSGGSCSERPRASPCHERPPDRRKGLRDSGSALPVDCARAKSSWPGSPATGLPPAIPVLAICAIQPLVAPFCKRGGELPWRSARSLPGRPIADRRINLQPPWSTLIARLKPCGSRFMMLHGRSALTLRGKQHNCGFS